MFPHVGIHDTTTSTPPPLAPASLLRFAVCSSQGTHRRWIWRGRILRSEGAVATAAQLSNIGTESPHARGAGWGVKPPMPALKQLWGLQGFCKACDLCATARHHNKAVHNQQHSERGDHNHVGLLCLVEGVFIVVEEALLLKTAFHKQQGRSNAVSEQRLLRR